MELSFEFSKDEHGFVSLEEAVGQALGAASMCWNPRPSDQVFDSEMATVISKELVKFIRERYDDVPHLGLATTGELLNEIRSRIALDYQLGGGGLDYTPKHGRPDNG
jgi:hypothetical protein